MQWWPDPDACRVLWAFVLEQMEPYRPLQRLLTEGYQARLRQRRVSPRPSGGLAI
jgi:hypothetical protein